MKAFIAVPDLPDMYPIAAIREGILTAGITFTKDVLLADVLITWSTWKHSFRESMAHEFRRARNPIITLENGWLSPIKGVAYYQVALDGWNGTGRFHVMDNDPIGRRRWQGWGIELSPWLRGSLFTRNPLVIGQRGHMDDPRTARPGWHEKLVLPCTGSPVRRSRDCPRPLLDDLRRASEVHVWTSNAASWAIVAGVPVVQHGPNLMVSELASRPGEPLRMPEREPVLERLAYAQWKADEIAAGWPFKWLLELVK